MRKLMIVLLVLAMLCATAMAAEIPSGVFTYVDAQSDLVEYASPLGFKVLIPYEDMFSVTTYEDSEFFVAADYPDGEIYLSVVKTAIPDYEAEAFLAEAIGGYEPDYVSNTAQGMTVGGNTAYSLLTTTDGITNIFCAVTNGPETLMITVNYPEIESENCFDLFNAMLTSIEF